MNWSSQEKSQSRKEDKQPMAILVLYEPGFRFKFKKYYLKKGINIIGSHPSSDVIIDDGPERIAMIMIKDDLAMIQGLMENAVIIMSNIKKKAVTALPMGVKYVIEMEKDFSLGDRKALMQVMTVEELWQVKNVENKQMFEKKEQPPREPPPASQNSNKTEELQPEVGDAFDPTLVIQENDYFDATLPLEQDFFQGMKNQPVPPVEKEKPKEPPQRRSQQVEEQVSMPDTLSQNQMPGTLEEGMPATIQEEKFQDADMGIKQTRTVPPRSNKKVEVEGRNFHSLKDKPVREIENFDDLFGSSKPQSNPSMPSIFNQKKKESQKKEENKKKGTRKNIMEESDGTEKMESDNEDERKKELKKVGVSNCRRQEINEKQLLKKGYKIIDNPDEPFQMLIIGSGEIKRSTQLFKALMDGKQIRSSTWITNPSAKIGGKIEGFLWEQVEKRKGKKGQIFQGNYYLQPEIRDQFQEVMRYGGATMLQALTRQRAKTSISIILDPKHPKGKELFEEKRNYKKWKFYSHKMIIESVLMGEEINQKYALDEYSF